MSLTKALNAMRARLAPAKEQELGTARHGNRQMRYYDPGANPMPRNHWKADRPRKKRSGKRTAADEKRIAKAEAKRQRKAARRPAA